MKSSDTVQQYMIPLAADTDNLLLLDYLTNQCLQQPYQIFCDTQTWIEQAQQLVPDNARFDLYFAFYHDRNGDWDASWQAIEPGSNKEKYDRLYASYIQSNYQFLSQFPSDKSSNLVASIGYAAAIALPQMHSLVKRCSITRNPHLTKIEKSHCIKFLQLMASTENTFLDKQLSYTLLEGLLDGEEKVFAMQAYKELEQIKKGSFQLQLIQLATPDLFVERLVTLGEVETFKLYSQNVTNDQ